MRKNQFELTRYKTKRASVLFSKCSPGGEVSSVELADGVALLYYFLF